MNATFPKLAIASFLMFLHATQANAGDPYSKSLASCSALMGLMEKKSGHEEQWSTDPMDFQQAASWFRNQLLRREPLKFAQQLIDSEVLFWTTEPDTKSFRKLLRKALRGCQWQLDARDQ